MNTPSAPRLFPHTCRQIASTYLISLFSTDENDRLSEIEGYPSRYPTFPVNRRAINFLNHLVANPYEGSDRSGDVATPENKVVGQMKSTRFE